MFYRSANANKLTVVVFALIIIFFIQANFGQQHFHRILEIIRHMLLQCYLPVRVQYPC